MLDLSPVIQNLGHRYLSHKEARLNLRPEARYSQQQAHFLAYKKQLKGTRIYKDLKLEHIESYEDFVQHIPVRSYEDFIPYVDMIVAGHKNILFNDEISYFGLSSGTSGKDSKRVPYNEKMIKQFLQAQKRTAARLTRLEPELEVLSAERLTFGSDPFLYSQNGFKFGYISGILSTRVPKILTKNTFPSQEILAVSEWDKKISLLIDEALHRDIEMVSGIPTYLISIFEAILKKTGRKEIREIWPNLKIFIYAATPIKQYEERLNKLVGQPLKYYGLYASTEAAIGLPYSAFQNGRQKYFLNPDLLYTFTESEGEKNTVGLHEVEMGKPYFINVSTPNGFVNYSMKDVVVFDMEDNNLIFEFVGRKSTGMNLAAEKVSDENILDCYLNVKKSLDLDFKHYLLSPTYNEDQRASYLWTLFVSNDVSIPLNVIAEKIDQEMMLLNPDYKDCRDVEVLGQPQVRLMSAQLLKEYFERNRSKGQFKMKTTFETTDEYIKFLENQMLQTPGVTQ